MVTYCSVYTRGLTTETVRIVRTPCTRTGDTNMAIEHKCFTLEQCKNGAHACGTHRKIGEVGEPVESCDPIIVHPYLRHLRHRAQAADAGDLIRGQVQPLHPAALLHPVHRLKRALGHGDGLEQRAPAEPLQAAHVLVLAHGR